MGLSGDIRKGNATEYTNHLGTVIAERDNIEDVRKAAELLMKLAEYKTLAKVEELEEVNLNQIDNVLSNTVPKSEEKREARQAEQERLAELQRIEDEEQKYRAILIPNESITDTPPEELPDKNQIILVYCRTGRRSKEASQKLADMGYVNVYEFGGIEDWTGDIVTDEPEASEETKNMKLYIHAEEIPVTWESNASVEELKTMLPLTIQMSMYGGFEQVGSLGESLPRNDEQITTEYGDIVLYSGNQMVVFYGSNSWEYTRLGHIDMTQEELTELLGNGDVEITLE